MQIGMQFRCTSRMSVRFLQLIVASHFEHFHFSHLKFHFTATFVDAARWKMHICGMAQTDWGGVRCRLLFVHFLLLFLATDRASWMHMKMNFWRVTLIAWKAEAFVLSILFFVKFANTFEFCTGILLNVYIWIDYWTLHCITNESHRNSNELKNDLYTG